MAKERNRWGGRLKGGCLSGTAGRSHAWNGNTMHGEDGNSNRYPKKERKKRHNQEDKRQAVYQRRTGSGGKAKQKKKVKIKSGEVEKRSHAIRYIQR
jgi:hypothetical protein